jgi:hypothetical protein
LVRRNRTVVFSPDNLSQIFAVSAHQFGRELISRPPNAKLWGIIFYQCVRGFSYGCAGAERRGGCRDQCGHRCGPANRDQRRYVAAGLPTTGKGAGFGSTFIIPRHLTESVVAANHVDVNRTANLDAGVAARHSHKAGTEFRASLRLFCSSRFGGRQSRILRSWVWLSQGLCRRS